MIVSVKIASNEIVQSRLVISYILHFTTIKLINLLARFLNPDRTVRSDWKTLEPFIFAVFLATKTALWDKNRDPCDPRSDLTVLRTVIRPLLTVPCIHLNLNL